MIVNVAALEFFWEHWIQFQGLESFHTSRALQTKQTEGSEFKKERERKKRKENAKISSLMVHHGSKNKEPTVIHDKTGY